MSTNQTQLEDRITELVACNQELQDIIIEGINNGKLNVSLHLRSQVTPKDIHLFNELEIGSLLLECNSAYDKDFINKLKYIILKEVV